MFARVENGGTEFWPRKKNAKMLDQKQQFSIGNQFVFFWPRKKQLLGGDNFKIGWPVSILGHIQGAPPVFWRKRRRCYIEKR